MVTLEREDEITGPVIAPLFPQVWQQVSFCSICTYPPEKERLW